MAFKFIVLFSILAAVNAGDLGSYVSYAEPTIQKTVAYTAPLTKAIYQPSAAYLSKTVYEPEPIQYNNYHSYTPSYGHHAYTPSYDHQHAYTPSYGHHAYNPSYGHGTVSHHEKVVATPHSYVNKYDTRIINEDPHYKVAAYSSVPVVKSYAAPVSYAAPTVVKSIVPSVPVVKSYAAPIAYSPTVIKSVPVVKSYEPDYHHHHYAHAPAVVKTAAISYSPASAVSHATFESVNAHYAW